MAPHAPAFGEEHPPTHEQSAENQSETDTADEDNPTANSEPDSQDQTGKQQPSNSRAQPDN
jgi:hypothetical protein